MKRLIVLALVAMGCGTTQQSLTLSPQVTMFAFKPVWVRAMVRYPTQYWTARCRLGLIA